VTPVEVKPKASAAHRRWRLLRAVFALCVVSPCLFLVAHDLRPVAAFLLEQRALVDMPLDDWASAAPRERRAMADAFISLVEDQYFGPETVIKHFGGALHGRSLLGEQKREVIAFDLGESARCIDRLQLEVRYVDGLFDGVRFACNEYRSLIDIWILDDL
jgi:hypothetical protein